MDPRGPRFQYHSFTVGVGTRDPEECRKSAHWKGPKDRCVMCGMQLTPDGKEAPEQETP